MSDALEVGMVGANTAMGHVTPTTGAVKVVGEKVQQPGLDRGLVFQHRSRLPQRTVDEKIAFGALHEQTRLIMRESLLEIWHKNGAAMDFVASDVEAEVFLVDGVLDMSAAPGRIIQGVTGDLPRPAHPAWPAPRHMSKRFSSVTI